MRILSHWPIVAWRRSHLFQLKTNWDELTAIPDGEASDADGDEVTTTVEWFKDGDKQDEWEDKHVHTLLCHPYKRAPSGVWHTGRLLHVILEILGADLNVHTHDTYCQCCSEKSLMGCAVLE